MTINKHRNSLLAFNNALLICSGYLEIITEPANLKGSLLKKDENISLFNIIS